MSVAFTSQSAAEAARKSHAPNARRTKRVDCLKQALALQNLCFDAAMQLKGTIPPNEQKVRAQAISQLVKAWDSAAERVRIARGRPLPGSLRPADKAIVRPAGSEFGELDKRAA